MSSCLPSCFSIAHSECCKILGKFEADCICFTSDCVYDHAANRSLTRGYEQIFNQIKTFYRHLNLSSSHAKRSHTRSTRFDDMDTYLLRVHSPENNSEQFRTHPAQLALEVDDVLQIDCANKLKSILMAFQEA